MIAEGVETAAQHAFLAAEGCPMGQGYRFGKPVPSAEFTFEPRQLPVQVTEFSFPDRGKSCQERQ
ncbi:PAS:GGDEF protein [Methylocaldum marinum]|uniref:PAS:GGDEF protein n=1 Tax=Methylocaldum marinum TaxID=1432792 RepID=A0A250KVP7_9GAMM|nr:EAL domain-containing protein [Methylocaldum marinum]BBA35687.1 PAS:GGDEF protein [Methylocaldum marinum]